MRGVRRRNVIIALAIASSPLFAGCDLFVPHWTYRYRVTVEVEQNGRLQSGSSVIEVRREKGLTGIGGWARGEAVAVDVGTQGTLFALLSGQRGGADWAFVMPHYAYRARLGTTDMVSGQVLDRLSEMEGVQATLDPADYPTLVRFRDIRDPKSVELVDPAHLAASFGPGVKLRRIIIQITDDPVTTGIEQRLPDPDDRGFFNWDGKSNPNEGTVVLLSDFMRGEKR